MGLRPPQNESLLFSKIDHVPPEEREPCICCGTDRTLFLPGLDWQNAEIDLGILLTPTIRDVNRKPTVSTAVLSSTCWSQISSVILSPSPKLLCYLLPTVGFLITQFSSPPVSSTWSSSTLPSQFTTTHCDPGVRSYTYLASYFLCLDLASYLLTTRPRGIHLYTLIQLCVHLIFY